MINKRILTVITLFVIVSSACTSSHKSMRVNYETLRYKDRKMLKGVINRSILEKDTAFSWFTENKKYGTPDAAAVKNFALLKNDFSIIAFGGTWCEDTQNLLPRFYQLIDASGFPEKQVTLIAVDRQKKTINHLDSIYKITNVPTFIVIHNGKEIGRVVEYGTKGDVTKELGEMVSFLLEK